MELSWTDKSFLGLLLISIILCFMSLRKKHTRRAFQRIFHRPIAVSAGIVLLFFLVIGVLDSIHLKQDSIGEETEISSLDNDSILDKILSPLGSNYENTYSAPLALNLYSIETRFVKG